MPCYKPVTAFKPLEGGALAWREKRGHREIRIPCGQCIGCRLRKQNAWALRCMCEAQMHSENWFPTLTYRDEDLPEYGSLRYRDFQLFAHRLRKSVGAFRYFVAGEYGENFSRPHFHALMFGLHLPDLDRVHCSSPRPIYRSKLLEEAWGKGNVFLGTVTLQSARYCASYTLKKVVGDLADEHYQRVVPETGEIVSLAPEMARMSLKPGIGASWLDKFWPEVVAHDGVVSDGRVHPVPRFFDQRMRAFEDDALAASIESTLEQRRSASVARRQHDLTADRLAVREQCALARVKFFAER